MTTYTWTDDMMRSGSTCDVDKVADNLMHLKYNAGGLLQINDLGTVTSNFTLDVNKLTLANVTANVTLSLPSSGLINGVENKCVLDFTTANASYPAIDTTGITLKRRDAKVLTFSTVSGTRNRLVFTTIDGGSSWEVELFQYGGVEIPFSQPTLSMNGTLGGSSFAVYASCEYSSDYAAYKAFDSNTTGTWWGTPDGTYPLTYIFYNPVALKVSNLAITNQPYPKSLGSYVVYGSNDNSNWTALTSGTNTNATASSTWNIPIPTASQGFYLYYKIYSSTVNTQGGIAYLAISAVYTAV